jgi:hypothetical protein
MFFPPNTFLSFLWLSLTFIAPWAAELQAQIYSLSPNEREAGFSYIYQQLEGKMKIRNMKS